MSELGGRDLTREDGREPVVDEASTLGSEQQVKNPRCKQESLFLPDSKQRKLRQHQAPELFDLQALDGHRQHADVGYP